MKTITLGQIDSGITPEIRRLVTASLFLLASAGVFVYALSWTLRAHVLDPAAAVGAYLGEETQATKARIAALRTQEKTDAEKPAIASLPDFLTRLSDIARQAGVSLTTMRPKRDTPSAFEVEFVGEFRQFVAFISEIEYLDIRISDLAIRPTEIVTTPPSHDIAITLVPQNNARRLDIPRLSQIRAEMEAGEQRNPFQRLAERQNADDSATHIDLTWQHHLTAIGRINGIAIATIDGRDYGTGDRLADREVVEIGFAHVVLRQGGDREERRFVIGFREVRENDPPAETAPARGQAARRLSPALTGDGEQSARFATGVPAATRP